MVLKELIDMLAAHDPTQFVPYGFGKPHSYRGYYDELAFKPIRNTTVGAMLREAQLAIDATYTGYKGGEYKMGEYTECWLAQWGRTGETIGPVLLAFMLGDAPPYDEAA